MARESKNGGASPDFSINPAVLYRDLRDGAAMFWAVIRLKYPLPKRSFIWFLLFLLYFLLPFDLVPEMVFLFLGLSDDLLLLVYILNKMRLDIDNYRAWRERGGSK